MSLLPAGSIIARRFRVHQAVTTTATGAVYSCTGVANENERVFIKIMRGFLARDREDRGRFHREYELLSRTFSTHIARALEIGDDDGTPFMVLEHLEGEVLR